MGKRSDFARRDKDFYPTPYEAVEPLMMHLMPYTSFIEPCVGAGDLVRHLEKNGHICKGKYDLPDDATTKQYTDKAECFITNPPWDREILHPLIDNLSSQKRTWLLFDAGWMFTKQAVPYLRRCAKIVTVGRVKWIPGSKMVGKDDCCWYLFNDATCWERTQFFAKSDYAKSIQYQLNNPRNGEIVDFY
jgi:hypothetical protein